MNRKLDTDQQVFFYEQDFYVLSNFSAFRLKWKGLDFDTSEAAYHWEKFKHLGDDPIANLFLTTRSAHDAFKLAEHYKSLRRPDWDEVKVPIMRAILRAKAEQHEYVLKKLLETGSRELIEDSWRDDFWGWGPEKSGLNMLGKLWMEVREELRITVTMEYLERGLASRNPLPPQNGGKMFMKLDEEYEGPLRWFKRLWSCRSGR